MQAKGSEGDEADDAKGSDGPNPWLERLWGEEVKFARLRFCLIGVCLALVVLHAIAPNGFKVDLTTLGLIVIAVAIGLEPLIESITLPGGTGVKFRARVDRLADASAEFRIEGSSFIPRRDLPPPIEPQDEPEPAMHDANRPTPEESEPESGPETGPTPEPELEPAEDSCRPSYGRWIPIPIRDPDAVVDRVLREASSSPRLGLISMATELESETNRLLAISGWGQGRRRWPLRQAVDKLIELGQLPTSMADIIKSFVEVRNLAVHGPRRPDEDDVVAAVSAGIDIYLGIAGIPRQTHLVRGIGVPLYSDEALSIPIRKGCGVILMNVGPDEDATSESICPTTQDYFEIGDEVAWGWGRQGWGPAWYRHPRTGKVEHAWDGALEFLGPPLRML